MQKINFKYKPTDKVFFLNKNKVVEAEVRSVLVNLNIDGHTIEYNVKLKNEPEIWHFEENLFPTKKLLLNSL